MCEIQQTGTPGRTFRVPYREKLKRKTGSVRRLYCGLETIRTQQSVFQPESLAERNGCRECTGHHLCERE